MKLILSVTFVWRYSQVQKDKTALAVKLDDSLWYFYSFIFRVSARRTIKEECGLIMIAFKAAENSVLCDNFTT